MYGCHILRGANKPPVAPQSRKFDILAWVVPGANFYLTHPFLDLVSARISNWQTAHARVGGVQPLNHEPKLEMALF